MKRLLVLVLICINSSAFGYTYKIYNQTRSKLAVKFNIVALSDEDIIVDPESYKEVNLGGLRTGACLRAIEIKGLTEPIADLGTKRVEIQGNKCASEIHFYIQHKNPIYVNRTPLPTDSASSRFRSRDLIDCLYIREVVNL